MPYSLKQQVQLEHLFSFVSLVSIGGVAPAHDVGSTPCVRCNLFFKLHRFETHLRAGIANPVPVIQTFFADSQIKGAFRLDSVAKHTHTQRARKSERVKEKGHT